MQPIGFDGRSAGTLPDDPKSAPVSAKLAVTFVSICLLTSKLF